MDSKERFAGLEEALRLALDAAGARIWTTLPGIIVSFDADAVTAVVQPALQGVIQSQDGTAAAVDLPLLIHVPVVFPRGGGVTLTFPIAEGDECQLSFSARCIDGWWQSGGVQLPMDTRMHDLSDAFCTVGPQSQVKKISGISTTTAQLRTDDGEAYIELDPASHAINAVTSGDVTVNADGDVDITAGGDAAVTVGGDLDVVAVGHIEAQASSVQVTAPHIRLIGIVDVVGALNVSGLASLNGGFGALPRAGGGASTIASDLTISGATGMQAATMTSSMVGGKDNGPAHRHISGGAGSPTGGII